MKKEIKINDNQKNCTFLPVTKLDSRVSEPITHQDLHHALPRDYDINYVIKFCRILIDKIDRYKIHTRDLPFTLIHSLKRLVAHLEVERDQTK